MLPKHKARTGLESGLGKEHAEAVEKLMQDNADKEVKAMWNKYGDDIKVGDAKHQKVSFHREGSIYVDVEKDSAGYKTSTGVMAKSPYQVTVHESGHAIDHAVSAKVGYNFSAEHNGGRFEKLLIQETNAYMKSFQKGLNEKHGRKFNIEETRKELSKSLFAENDWLSTGMMSDIMGGATKGKFNGTSGHAKSYWTGWKDYWGKTHDAHSVASEAFAHFTSIATNSRSAARLKSVFPESYKEYLSMCQFAATLE